MDAPLDKVLINTPPPPPMEVKIRTMRSDIESMRKSGGGMPSFQDVAVKGLSMEKEYHPSAVTQTPMPPPTSAPVQASAPVSSPMPPREVAPTPVPPTQEISSAPAASGSHLVPILIVTLVALFALAAVGYFAYTLFIK